MKLKSLDRFDGFTLVKAELDRADEHGDGVRIAYGCGLWRAWKLAGGRPVNPSSGWFNKAEDALNALDAEKEDDMIMPARKTKVSHRAKGNKIQ